MRKPFVLAVVGVAVLAAFFFIFHPFSNHHSKDHTHGGSDGPSASADAGGDKSSSGGRGGKRGGKGGMNGPMPVAVAPVEKSDIKVTRSALGTVTPLATVTVKTQIAGQLVQIAFKEGQLVQKGDFLAEIDPRPYQLALQQAQGQLGRDQALLKDAQINLARYQKLMKEDSIARQQLDTQKSLVNQYIGTIKTDQAQVDNAKLNIAYCHIVAPVSGRVGLRQVDQGNYVQTGDANGIVVITQIMPIAVVFTLPEDDLMQVMGKVNAGTELEADAFDRTKSVKLATGTLTAVDNQIDTTTGTVKLRAEFSNEDQKLFPNQFVNVSLLIDTLRDVTTVPSAAVQRGADSTFVYQVKPDKTVLMHTVQIGTTDGDKVQITSDLTPGDQVVTDGADKLKDGSKVTLPQENANANAGASDAKDNKGAAGAAGNESSPAKPDAVAPDKTEQQKFGGDGGQPSQDFGAKQQQQPAAQQPASQPSAPSAPSSSTP